MILESWLLEVLIIMMVTIIRICRRESTMMIGGTTVCTDTLPAA